MGGKAFPFNYFIKKGGCEETPLLCVIINLKEKLDYPGFFIVIFYTQKSRIIQMACYKAYFIYILFLVFAKKIIARWRVIYGYQSLFFGV